MALLPARNILDGSALPVTSQMKTALGSLHDYCSDLLGTDSSNKSAARTALGAAASGANADITSLTGLTTPLSMAQGGSGMVNGFASSKASSGYQKLPSGLIIQWGMANPSNTSETVVTLPIAFPVAFVSVSCLPGYTPGSGVINGVVVGSRVGLTQIAFRAASSTDATWIAIGY